ncbi:MAG: hypothetical protein AAGJ34_13310 [Pseudomonadota bacterium]
MRAGIAVGILATGTLVGACAPDPRNYESEPVLVKTDRGIVTCQLYTDNQVLWDEAIDFPANHMTLSEADEICEQEGQRVKREGRTPASPDEPT